MKAFFSCLDLLLFYFQVQMQLKWCSYGVFSETNIFIKFRQDRLGFLICIFIIGGNCKKITNLQSESSLTVFSLAKLQAGLLKTQNIMLKRTFTPEISVTRNTGQCFLQSLRLIWHFVSRSKLEESRSFC